MKLKVYVIDLEIAPGTKRWALRLGIPIGLLLGGGALAWAANGLTTWAPGDTLQASTLNDNFTYIQGEITPQGLGPRTPSAFRAELSVPLKRALQPATTTPILFDKALFDFNGEYDPSTGTFSPKTGGIYLLTCALNWETGAAGEVQSAILWKNGQDLDGTDLVAGGASKTYSRPEVTTIVQLSATDSVVCAAYTNLGEQPNLGWPHRNQFAAVRLY